MFNAKLFYFMEDFKLDCIELFFPKEFKANDPSLVGVLFRLQNKFVKLFELLKLFMANFMFFLSFGISTCSGY